MDRRDTGELINFDPHKAADVAVGKRGPESDRLGFALATRLKEAKEKHLAGMGDTFHQCSLETLTSALRDLGFGEPAAIEGGYVSVLPQGVAATFSGWQSGDGLRVNQADIWFNWKPHRHGDDSEDADIQWMLRRIHCGGGWKDPASPGTFHGRLYFADPPPGPADRARWTWIGECDVREALVHKLSELVRVGTFVAPWIATPRGLAYRKGALEALRAAGIAPSPDPEVDEPDPAAPGAAS
jgi:hypothetical protein